jgi:hypothetical protein
MDERSRPPRRGGPWAGRIPWGKTAVRITVGGITLGGVDCLAALLGSGELQVALFVASTDAAAARLATGHRLGSCPTPDTCSKRPARSTRSPAWPPPGGNARYPVPTPVSSQSRTTDCTCCC